MKLTAILFILLAFVIETLAQPQTQPEGNVISRRSSLRVMPLYQRWSSDSSAFSEFSSVVSVYQPVSRNASVSLYGSFGSASGDLTSLSGAAEVQLSGNYFLESANLIFSLGLGIPSGKKKLTGDEFLTSVFITNNVFRFQVPHFGTGFNLAPGIIWALPVNDDFVLGLGASFQYRGSYNPLENLGSYDPGDEVSETVGLDVRIDETSSLSGDVVFTHYGKDKLDGSDVFSPGNKVLGVLQFKKYFSLDELLLLATFRTKAKPDIGIGNNQPNQAEVLGAYTAHFTDKVVVQFSLEGRFFQETTAPFSGYNLVGVGVMPEFTLSESVRVPLRIKYMNGKATNSGALSGIEAGLGLVVSY